MFAKLKNRYIIFSIVAFVMFAVLVLQLFSLTILNGAYYSEQSQTKKTRSITLTGQRGSIFDKNGIPLAYDEKSYNVEFYKDPAKSASSDKAHYTDIILNTIKIIEKNGGKVIDTFNIKKNSKGEFYFDFGITDKDAKTKREKNWRENMYISDEKSTPEQIYYQLRERYRLPESLSYEEAFKVLSIWQEVQLSTWVSYIPVTIATDVSTDTVAQIEAYSSELEGMQIEESTSRVYPRDSLAAHVIGYLGRMTDANQIKKMEAKGYDANDLIGIMGVESTMEDYLTGEKTENQGKRVIEVDTSGTITDEISYKAPTDGDNVVLTIDSQMQAKLEAALESNIKEVHEKQVEQYNGNKAHYDEKLNGREPNLAISGAAVVMEVSTGRVLAMASYPSFNLNLFANGIDDKTYQELATDKAAPLFNKAISSKSIPGSIFKLVTATGGLMQNAITLNETIDDEGPFNKYIKEGSDEEGPACWVEPQFWKHKDQNLVAAIKNSCNYYFFTVADRLGIESLNEWAQKLGLTEKTGIQLTNEVAGQIGCQKTLYDNTKEVSEQKTALPRLVYNKLVEDFKRYGTARNITYTDDELKNAAGKIIKLAGNGKTEKGPDIRKILSDQLDIPDRIARTNGWDIEVSSRLSELEWNPTQTVIVGIGQSLTAVTPIAVARYISAILNGGKVYEAQIVEKVVDAKGNTVEEFSPKLVRDLKLPSNYIDAMKEGMKEVVSGEDHGTAAELFKDFDYPDEIGGKTGTAQVTKDVDIENNGWFLAFAPFDKPEIAVVVLIPNGLSGLSAGPTARDIIEYYLSNKEKSAENSSGVLPSEGTQVR